MLAQRAWRDPRCAPGSPASSGRSALTSRCLLGHARGVRRRGRALPAEQVAADAGLLVEHGGVQLRAVEGGRVDLVHDLGRGWLLRSFSVTAPITIAATRTMPSASMPAPMIRPSGQRLAASSARLPAPAAAAMPPAALAAGPGARAAGRRPRFAGTAARCAVAARSAAGRMRADCGRQRLVLARAPVRCAHGPAGAQLTTRTARSSSRSPPLSSRALVMTASMQPLVGEPVRRPGRRRLWARSFSMSLIRPVAAEPLRPRCRSCPR